MKQLPFNDSFTLIASTFFLCISCWLTVSES